MGLLPQHVSRVVLQLCVIMLLQDHFVADAEQTAEPFINKMEPSWFCGMYYGAEYKNISNGPSQRCLFPAPIRFKENATGPMLSFSTKYIAVIGLGQPPSSQLGYGLLARNTLEGFTFGILPHPNASLGGDGGYLGLLNATTNGDAKSHTFAVEFDFVKSPQFSDPNEGFHIGIDINSMRSNYSVHLEGPSNSNLWQLQVWIDYDASSQNLTVSTTNISLGACALRDEERPGLSLEWINETTPIFNNSLSVQVDLSNVLNEHMYVGFTSSVAVPQDPDAASAFLEIYNWSLRTSTWSAGPSASLPCSIYPRNHSLFELHPIGTLMLAILVSLTVMVPIYALLYKRYSRWVERRRRRFKIDPNDLAEADPHKFTYRELTIATKNFDPKQVLGRGGFGSVYKGFLPGNKQYVAVKRVAPESNQGEREFMAEVMIIGKIRHRNLVRLQGWCHEQGELLLVYDYMPQGSLDKHLFNSLVPAMPNLPNVQNQQGVNKLVVVDEEVVVAFPWERRFKVVVDVATALVYLHTECEERIIHRDIKVANVMLDAKFNARLGDFGLARSYNHSLLIPESTNVAGTFGYFAPELYHTGKQTEETDVYSFGAFLLEVACGKKPIYHKDGEVLLLVEQMWHMWGSSRILDAADEHLIGIFNVYEMEKVLSLGLLCSHPSPSMRPSMRQVLLILNDDMHLPEVPLSKPQFDYMPRKTPLDLSCSSHVSSMYYTTSTTS